MSLTAKKAFLNQGIILGTKCDYSTWAPLKHQSEQGDYSKHMQIQWAHLTSNTMCEKPMEQDTSYNMQKESTKQNGNEF